MKRTGRPPLAKGDTSVNVCFRLPTKQYDLTQRHATEARLSFADWMRQAVDRAVREKRGRGNSGSS